ncbi:3,4-dihydroxy-2-butanone-4-phosphate synthase [Iodidimonas gelatinilytica]|uniref:3,4-dihydroxy-2-butanone 4-phosphate synthase n=1 Tax=Iodidimonas gelatinilytica TaxID=1236966 RepID=A0A5A7MZ68_9PROT|nr:3,4-dihydroxy-2-butanone-4-phosphate synthase [Iodidimonas gelatinilytica]GEQ98116.1 3,4-dihydroxy-2-butanone-4-phosphate synthase [Iodidimonas gelatinilytica]GER00704.1 3,4-dihydroxy-2-butanone-4-phosphate synthase [Iodidimonas gelatinilytica]
MSESFLSSIEEVIEDARNGRMFILVDDEDRENEGDLIIPAQMATPEAINFMAKHGRGLICLSLTRQRAEDLGLSLMSQENASRHQTAFTVSIEAREGVTTGISAADRARTIQVAIDSARGRDDLATPGHVFPLVARDGGVLVRAGHTEASVDISRLAGLNPSSVICEIMNEDGTMARLPDLMGFAQLHGLKVATIRDLIAYRLKNDSLVDAVSETEITSLYGGEWHMKTYVNRAEYAEHIVLVKGDLSGPDPVLVRMHAISLFDDILAEDNGRAGQLHQAMRCIGKEGRGIVVIIRDVRPDRLTQEMQARSMPKKKQAVATAAALRDYGIGAQILLDLGVRDLVLLSNTQHNIVGLEAMASIS